MDALARATDPATSHEAAERVTQSGRKKKQAAALCGLSPRYEQPESSAPIK